VTITEFSDFQCPYCKRAASVVDQVRRTYGKRVKVIFKQLPLSFHQYAFKAAQASVCAQGQGKFWEYHDGLFASSELSADALKRIAAEVGLKQKDFSQCLNSVSSQAVVEKDIADANRLGVRGTPTFFVNGTPLRGVASFAALKQEIDGAMLGVHRTAARTISKPPNVWQALPKNGRGQHLGLIQQAALTQTANQPQQAALASTTTVEGVTLSPASINFGYQLVGTTGPQFTETVTNSGPTPLTITDISVSGRDRGNFPFSYSFTLPVTVAPGNSIAINFTFNPALPWRAGTRNARLEISEGSSSQYVPLTGIGATCLGPVPACSSGCPDSDGDGLNDAWEIAGGIDIDNDGVIDASKGDVLLPGADPNRPDIYIKYDYMATQTHSHQPPAKAWDQMQAMFAAHGITLHVLAPASAIPEHHVTTLDPNATSACAGNDFITMQQLRTQYLGNLRYAYHYMVFAHDSTTPHDGSLVAACPVDALCGSRPTAGATGVADLPGGAAIISFGAYVDSNTQIGIELWASTMMHELGHNFGLVHGSLADPGNAAQECLNFKPNYISVMNFTYQLDTIVPVTAPGTITPISCSTDADCGPPAVTSGTCATSNSCFCTDDLGPGNNVCYRPDYAEDDLLNLNETTLDEHVGVGGPPSLDDIVWYFYEGGTLPGPSNGGPIDWDNNGVFENLSTCVNALPPGQGPNGHCPDINNDGLNNDQMDTTADWTQVNGQFINFNFQFQCTAAFQSGSGAPVSQHEVGFEWLREHHMLHPPRIVSIGVSPGCSSARKPVTVGQPGTVRVAVLGSNGFDVTHIEPSSLKLHGASALNVTTKDVNGDGKLDLVATFDTSALKLHPRATVARLTGWLHSGQSFVGEDKIRVVSSLAGEDPSCR
jgi:predicted DsbA family dithiol-disulfide isomerase